MDKIIDLKQQRGKLIKGQRDILERAGIENGEYRALSTEDMSTVDKMAQDVDSIDQLIERLQALEPVDDTADRDEEDSNTEDKKDEESRSRSKGQARSRPVPIRAARVLTKAEKVASKEYRSKHSQWLKTGVFDDDDRQYRDITVSPNTSGGYLATPTKISDDVVQIINNLCFVRKLSKVETVTDAVSLGVRQLLTQPSDALWTAEIGAVQIDTSTAFGQRPLTPNLLSKGMTVSMREMGLVSDIDDIVSERIGYKHAVAEENGYMTGNGVNQPLGVFTPSASGIPTSQDFVCSASGSTQITADQLIAAKYNLKQPYLNSANAAWIFSRAATAQIRLLKDQYGRYLWVDGGGFNSAPDTILGIPNYISEYAPSTFTAGAYVGLLGNFDYYRIAQVAEMQIQRLVELYAGTNEVGFIGRRWVDGAPVLGEAFVRLQLHS